VGSLVAVVIYFFLPISGDSIAFFLLTGVGLLAGIWATGSLITPLDHDPRQAVWDEFVGMWVTCFFLPKTIPWLIVAFSASGSWTSGSPGRAAGWKDCPAGWGLWLMTCW
jgi:phosphatidylglycerophosphatase A